MKPDPSYLNLKEFAAAVASRMGNAKAPSYHTIRKAIRKGLPNRPHPTTGHPLIEKEEGLAWWFDPASRAKMKGND